MILVRLKRILKTDRLHHTGPAYCFGLFYLLKRRTGGSSRKKQIRIGVAARREFPPVVAVDRFAMGLDWCGHIRTLQQRLLFRRDLSHNPEDFIKRRFAGTDFENTVLKHGAHTALDRGCFDGLSGHAPVTLFKQLADLTGH